MVKDGWLGGVGWGRVKEEGEKMFLSIGPEPEKIGHSENAWQ